MPDPRLVAIVGKKNSGKTTLVVALVEYARFAYYVATGSGTAAWRPDVADAFVSTFARKMVFNKSREERMRERELLKEFDFYRDKAKGLRLKK